QVTWETAMPLFQNFALGITDADLLKIPVDTESINPELDTDGDGYKDEHELKNGYNPYNPQPVKFNLDNKVGQRLKGRLLLQVQQGGAIWYVDIDGIRHNVRWNNLMYLFTTLALGITDSDLGEVGNVETANWQTYTNNEYGFEVKYPSTWNLEDNKELYLFTISENQGCKFIGGSFGSGLPSDYSYTIEKVIIDGRNFTKKFWKDGSGNIKYVIINDIPIGDGLQLTDQDNDSISQVCLDNFNQILSTFKFSK
ncbi:hypothetical protein KKA66_00530, partial [Patescibacteria group bacterium]|nr:hypothetical protein [Patescibacteria group bacterium]